MLPPTKCLLALKEGKDCAFLNTEYVMFSHHLITNTLILRH